MHILWDCYGEVKEQTRKCSLESYAGNFEQSSSLSGVISFSKRETWLPVLKDKKYVFLIILDMKSNPCCDILMMSAQTNQLLSGIKFLLHTCGLKN